MWICHVRFLSSTEACNCGDDSLFRVVPVHLLQYRSLSAACNHFNTFFLFPPFKYISVFIRLTSVLAPCQPLSSLSSSIILKLIFLCLSLIFFTDTFCLAYLQAISFNFSVLNHSNSCLRRKSNSHNSKPCPESSSKAINIHWHKVIIMVLNYVKILHCVLSK